MSWAARAVLISVGVIVLVTMLRMVGARHLRSKYALLWIVVGVLLLPLAAFPWITDSVADALGVSYAPALAFLGAFAVLLLISMHYSWELSRLEVRTRDLAQEVALLRRELDDRTARGADDATPVDATTDEAAREDEERPG